MLFATHVGILLVFSFQVGISELRTTASGSNSMQQHRSNLYYVYIYIYIYIYIYLSSTMCDFKKITILCVLCSAAGLQGTTPPPLDRSENSLSECPGVYFFQRGQSGPPSPPPAGRAVPMVCLFRRNPSGLSLSRGMQWAHALIGGCVRMSVSFRTFSVKCFTEKRSFSLRAPEDTLYPLAPARRECLYFSVQ